MGTPERDVAALALAEHVRSTGHQVNLSKAKVIDSHPFVTTRRLDRVPPRELAHSAPPQHPEPGKRKSA